MTALTLARKSAIVATAALIALCGCSKKRPAELPPSPGVAGSQNQPAASSDSTDTTIVPGSRADFLQQAGSDTVHFSLNHWSSQAKWLVAHPNVRVTIEGHCDERGTREYNLALGDRRANAAKNYLAAAGVSSDRMSTISYGKERPVALGSNESDWAQNRRAVTVVPQ